MIIISLNQAQERRNKLLSNGFPQRSVGNYFLATDLRYANETEIKRYADLDAGRRNYGRELRAAEVGCAVSHIQAYQHCLSKGEKLALVFEDDNILATPEAFYKTDQVYNRLIRMASAGKSFICNLGMPSRLTSGLRHRSVHPKIALDSPELCHYCDPVNRVWRANAYLISANAMTRIVNRYSKIELLADDWSAHLERGHLDLILFTKQPLFYQDETLLSSVQSSEPHITFQRPVNTIPKRMLSSARFRTAKLWSRGISYIPSWLP